MTVSGEPHREDPGGTMHTPESADEALDEHFGDRPEARALFEAIRAELAAVGTTEIRVSKSQVAFRRRHNVAVVWVPERYLGPGRGAPLVLTLSFRRRDPSPRWKEIVDVGGGRYTHHVELTSTDQVDHEIHEWLAEAWAAAG
jgi:predicted transport protein